MTVLHCLSRGGDHAAPDHVRLLLDCADLCATSARLLLRGSPYHARTCAACAVVCEACADDCERLAADDVAMHDCAEACRRCADSCREMGRMAA
jgi:hypothetical protein